MNPLPDLRGEERHRGAIRDAENSVVNRRQVSPNRASRYPSAQLNASAPKRNPYRIPRLYLGRRRRRRLSCEIAFRLAKLVLDTAADMIYRFYVRPPHPAARRWQQDRTSDRSTVGAKTLSRVYVLSIFPFRLLGFEKRIYFRGRLVLSMFW